MSEFICDEKRYLVSRTNEEKREDLAQIDEYSGNIYWVNTLERVYRFENIDEAKSFKLSQENLAKSLKKEWTFEILEEHTVVNKGE